LRDRRKLFRNYLSFFSRVIDRDSGYVLGYLVDLTARGALMIGSAFIKPGSTLALSIDLPEDISIQKQLDLVAKVVWVQPDVDPELYRIGLQLEETNSSDLRVLKNLLDNYASKK